MLLELIGRYRRHSFQNELEAISFAGESQWGQDNGPVLIRQAMVREVEANVFAKYGFDSDDASIDVLKRELNRLEKFPEIKQCVEDINCLVEMALFTTYENEDDQGEVPISGMTESFSDVCSPQASTRVWTLTKDAAIAVYNELRLQLSMPPFANQMKSLLDKGPTRGVEEERLKLIREAEQKAISLHVSEATNEGVKVLREVCKSWRSDLDVELLHKAICRDLHIDAFGDNPDMELAGLKEQIAIRGVHKTIGCDNPDMELAGLKEMIAIRGVHKTMGYLELVRKGLASSQFQNQTRGICAKAKEVSRSACGAKEIAEETAKKAAQDTVNVEKQYNSPRAATVVQCCRG